MRVFLDLETFSSVDISKCGAYKYVESDDFKILLLGYAIEDGPVSILDWQSATRAQRNAAAQVLASATEIVAHNAAFERLAMYYDVDIYADIPALRFTCTMVRASYCGLPLSLDDAAKALGLENQKLKSGKALIKYFCTPKKASKQKTLFGDDPLRNLPQDAPDKWEEFKEYLRLDIETCRELFNYCDRYEFTDKHHYVLDQKINDRGVLIDMELAQAAEDLNGVLSSEYAKLLHTVTGLDNPNSDTQLKAWLTDQLDEKITSLAADAVEALHERVAPGLAKEALRLRMLSSNRSVSKYTAALKIACSDDRARGLLQFYGSRTGRWSGRGIQPQNMPRNYMKTLEAARAVLKDRDFNALRFMYDDPQQVLKELLRTMIAAPKDKTFLVADFSAIEARVLAWLAGEAWRLEVFRGHGKIYEASASAMFGVPIEEIGKGSEYRAKGKIAELALGYQGGVGALESMGGAAMGLSKDEMKMIVKRWRAANPAMVKYWKAVEDAALRAVQYPNTIVTAGGCKFLCDDRSLLIYLPSGRPLIYYNPQRRPGKYGESLTYEGQNQITRQWQRIDTYGGKITENIVQAVARDLLAEALQNINAAGFELVLHVHDEAIAEADRQGADLELARMVEAMTQVPRWAEGLPLDADGFTTDFYIKD